MQRLLLLSACVALSGCLGFGKQTASEAEPQTQARAETAPVAQTSMTQVAKASETKVAKGTEAKVTKASATKVEQKPTMRPDCYTVVLFTEVDVEKPAPDVPDKYRRFHGRWTNGAWNGVWCHDLLVSKVEADGRVELVEMHAPYEPWNQPATAFHRVGRIDDRGNLHIAYGSETVNYRIEDGKLLARRSGALGRLKATLVRPGTAEAAAKLAQAEAAPEPGG